MMNQYKQKNRKGRLILALVFFFFMGSSIIGQAEAQSFQFRYHSEGEEEILIDSKAEAGNTYDFSAECKDDPTAAIQYSIEKISEDSMLQDDGTEQAVPMEEIAAIDPKGTLTVFAGGHVIRVIAEKTDTEGEKSTIECLLTLKCQEKDMVYFDRPISTYILGTNDWSFGESAKKKYEEDGGALRYTARMEDTEKDLEQWGMSMEEATGNIILQDLQTFLESIGQERLSVKMMITVEKEPGYKEIEGKKHMVYEKDSASYTLEIQFAHRKEDAFSLLDENGQPLSEANGKNGWYVTPITVVPTEKDDLIAKTSDLQFAGQVTFAEDGREQRSILLQNQKNGEITKPIDFGSLPIDREKPYDVSAAYSPGRFHQNIFFYHAPVTVTFTAYDDTSGVDTFVWKYTSMESASSSNLSMDEGTVKAVQDSGNPQKYTAKLVLPVVAGDQLKGSLSVCAIDQAGWVGEQTDRKEPCFAVDTIRPELTVCWQKKKEEDTITMLGDRCFATGDVLFTFQVKENNFSPEDMTAFVKTNGRETHAIQTEAIHWEKADKEDTYEGTYLLSGDGDYEIWAEYQDLAGHCSEKYHSPQITIDTLPPKTTFTYVPYRANGQNFKEEKPKAVLSILEHNFTPENLQISCEVSDLHGKLPGENSVGEELKNADWKQEGDLYSIDLTEYLPDGIYDCKIQYKDLAQNPAKERQTGRFPVDHKSPSVEEMHIEYSVPVLEKVLSAVTFGYYNPQVTVTFTAADAISGIAHIHWFYEGRWNGGELQDMQSGTLKVWRDAQDAALFHAGLTLPLKEAEKMKGSLSFTAADGSGNISDKRTDDRHIIIVDRISPKIQVEYSQPDNRKKQKLFYRQPGEISFFIKEDHFYGEDVKAAVSKDNKKYRPVKIRWKSLGKGEYVGKYKILAPEHHKRDGSYRIRIRYRDRSGNEMKEYLSKQIIVDTKNPEIQVSYAQEEPAGVFQDAKGQKRSFFRETREAEITVMEENFQGDLVQLQIEAQDVTGKNILTEQMVQKTSWKTEGKKHTMKLYYTGDANYRFAIQGTDLAGNSSVKYPKDFFTIDRKPPEDLGISYSESVWEKILQGISFGFYQAKATVTLQAKDAIAGIESFRYHLSGTKGISDTKSHTENREAKEGRIEYGKDGMGVLRLQIPEEYGFDRQAFCGSLLLEAADWAGNVSQTYGDQKKLVVDQMAPEVSVTYPTPDSIRENISYYRRKIQAVVRVKERNFLEEKIQVWIEKDGQKKEVSPIWKKIDGEYRESILEFKEDGEYRVQIACQDPSGNGGMPYRSSVLSVDTKIRKPLITVNKQPAKGRAFRGKVMLEICAKDRNLLDCQWKMERTQCGKQRENITALLKKTEKKIQEEGEIHLEFLLKRKEDMDGIYRLQALVTDRAGNSRTETAVFTVNRFGSIYEYGEALSNLIKEGGQYVKEIPEDLVVTEYNASRLQKGSLRILLTRDGKPIEKAVYLSQPEISGGTERGSSGWYQYCYKIGKENFAEDGAYKVSVLSKDEAGNHSENTDRGMEEIVFRVDHTPPEIYGIKGSVTRFPKEENTSVNFRIYDSMGLSEIKVYSNDRLLKQVKAFPEDSHYYEGVFKIQEKPIAQRLRITAKDLAGNTAVSTHFLVNWDFGPKAILCCMMFAAVGVCAVLARKIFVLKNR